MDEVDDTAHTPAPERAHPGGAEPVSSHARGVGSGRSERDGGFAGARGAEQNRLLAALPVDEYTRVLAQLTPVRLHVRDVLVEADVPLRDVWFVREGVCSVIATEQEGGDVEVGTIGREGLVGLPVVNGVDTTPHRVLAQIEGEAWRLGADEFRRLIDERPPVRRLLLRYAQYFTEQVSQSAACNRLHTLEERAARWLLMTHDRVEGDSVELTHEFLAPMLGVRRAGVTVALGTLQADGIVRYMRGRMTVLDRRRLEEASCGCYAIARGTLDRLR